MNAKWPAESSVASKPTSREDIFFRATLFSCQSPSAAPSLCPPVPAAQPSSLIHHIQNSCDGHGYIPPPLILQATPCSTLFNPNQLLPPHSPPHPLLTPTPSRTPHVTGRPDQLSGRLAALPLSLPVLAGASPGQLSALLLEASGAPTQSETSARTTGCRGEHFFSLVCLWPSHTEKKKQQKKPHCSDIS